MAVKPKECKMATVTTEKKDLGKEGNKIEVIFCESGIKVGGNLSKSQLVRAALVLLAQVSSQEMYDFVENHALAETMARVMAKMEKEKEEKKDE